MPEKRKTSETEEDATTWELQSPQGNNLIIKNATTKLKILWKIAERSNTNDPKHNKKPKHAKKNCIDSETARFDVPMVAIGSRGSHD